MDPLRETKLWPHQNNEIYQAFDRIFDCRGHGWSNLQSCHINFPFETEEEFGRLHAAIRLVLPLLPALAASSPYKEGVRGEDLDTRLATYRTNCARVPLVTGNVIPEQVFN
jgi:gamma-glutamyl:cysteine ligase YbdK (ATP-grasp superfamily)